MSTHRLERLQEEIRQIVRQIFLFEVQDPRIKEVVVTHVRLAKDLGFARVYYELPKEAKRGEAEEGLEKANGYLRSAVASRLKLRLTPKIEFHYDETSEEEARVEELFSKL
ncbi:MAG: 30S ribosome-binding factor RbfA [Deltaproteobacteria bacterium]|nr:30S ribosome-binding factor RbfA [Deltaproteobacteria bacterium]MBI4374080.1 30S ribosome-binding factor RbfA [Deltaproteobacteria bacterium]